jgi:hypothetical protein
MAKLKRTNLGTKEKYDAAAPSSKSETVYPRFYVCKKLPLEKNEIGKFFEVKAKIKFTGLNQRTNESSDDFDYNFEIINIEF